MEVRAGAQLAHAARGDEDVLQLEVAVRDGRALRVHVRDASGDVGDRREQAWQRHERRQLARGQRQQVLDEGPAATVLEEEQVPAKGTQLRMEREGERGSEAGGAQGAAGTLCTAR